MLKFLARVLYAGLLSVGRFYRRISGYRYRYRTARNESSTSRNESNASIGRSVQGDRASTATSIGAYSTAWYSRWTRLPQSDRTPAALRGFFPLTPRYLHTIKFVSLEPDLAEGYKPYNDLPGVNTHHFYVLYRAGNEKPIILISAQMALHKVGRPANWIAAAMIWPLIESIENAPDLRVEYLLRLPPTQPGEVKDYRFYSRADLRWVEARENFWMYHLDKAFRSIKE